jgi:hydroxymethylbilane synthase
MKLNKNKNFRIGTRGSELALAQANEVKAKICNYHQIDESQIEIIVISTKGDEVTDRPLSEIGGKGLFSKEIELALSKEEIDLAVHSTKDMATTLPEDLEIIAFLPREDPRDAFLSHKYQNFDDLPEGATVGSSSMRRKAMILNKRPDLNVVMFRGNVQTRLKKLSAGEVDATFLAYAGIKRLGLEKEVKQILSEDDFLPAPAQGAICIETRIEDVEVFPYIRALNDHKTEVSILCERAFLKTLDGSCQTPIAGLSAIEDSSIRFTGKVLSDDGQEVYEVVTHGKFSDCEVIGREAGEKILQQTGRDFFKKW